MHTRKIIAGLVTSLALCSCQQQQSPVSAEAIIQPSKGGDFRGVFLGDNPTVIKRQEESSSVYSMPDELIYRAYPKGMDSMWYEISYNFNHQGLYDISLDVFPKTDVETRDLKTSFITYYKQRYGECAQTNGYCSWRAMTLNGHIVSITLTDSLQFDHKPCLRVNFNESSQ